MSSTDDFDSLIQRYAGRVLNHAYRMLRNKEDAEEATHDVFLRIAGGLSAFQEKAELSTWIWRITTNVCLTRLAKKKVPLVSLDDQEGGNLDSDVDASSNPELLFLQQEEREQLAECIALLPEREAAAVALFYLDELSYDEIGEILQMPAGSVGTALHRGRKRLREIIKQRRL